MDGRAQSWGDAERAEFVRAARAAGEAREVARRVWVDAARQQAAACAAALAGEFGARRVVLFGSVARGDAREGSDVDLLVTGIAPERWFDAVARAMDIVSAGEVDLVPADKVHAHVATRIAEEGVVLVG